MRNRLVQSGGDDSNYAQIGNIETQGGNVTVRIEQYVSVASAVQGRLGKEQQHSDLFGLGSESWVMMQMERVTTAVDLAYVLRYVPLSHEGSAKILECMLWCPQGIVFFRDLLCDVVFKFWHTEHIIARKAAAVLTGVTRRTDGYGDRTSDVALLIEEAIASRNAALAEAVESLAFPFAVASNERVYYGVQKIMLEDTEWGAAIAIGDIAYCGNAERALLTRFDHLRSRSKLGFASSHDACRVIYLFRTWREDISRSWRADPLWRETVRSLHWSSELQQMFKKQVDVA